MGKNAIISTLPNINGLVKSTGSALVAATAGTDYIAGGVGTNNFIPKFTGSGVIANSTLQENGTGSFKIGNNTIGTSQLLVEGNDGALYQMYDGYATNSIQSYNSLSFTILNQIGATSTSLMDYNYTTKNLTFQTNGNNTRLTINGTTGAATFSSSVTANSMVVDQGGINIKGTGSTAKPTMLRLSNASDGAYYWDIWRDNTTGYLNFGAATGGSLSTFLTIKDVSGNVGINTSSPGAKLEIFGTGNTLRLDSAANGAKTILLRNVGTATAEIKTDGNLDFNIEDANRTMRFLTSNTERMRITSGGYVRVGTNSTSLGSNALFSVGSSGYGAFGVIAYGQGTGTWDSGISINQGNAGMAALVLASVHTSDGTATQSALYLVNFYYSGNNTPAATFIAGSNFVTFGKSGSNTLTLTTSGIALVQYTIISNK